MAYLSLLQIDISQVRGRTWLANPYRVHQRLLMAFPDGESGRVLYRVEEDHTPPRILVQAPALANWEETFSDHQVLLASPIQKEVALAFRSGQRLRFLLRANPTVRRVRWDGDGEDRKIAKGPRMGLMKEVDQRAWLARKGEAAGFRPLAFEVNPRGNVVFRRGNGEASQTHFQVDFQGVLQVLDPAALQAAWQTGIGPGKAFGFGLLSLAPAR